MNRKKLLKELKKNKKINNNIEEENYMSRFVNTLVFLLLIAVVGYVLVGIFLTKSISFKHNDSNEESEEVSIDNTTILAGNIFSINKDTYYVLIYDVNEKNSELKDWVNYFKSNNDVDIYIVDSKNKLNSKYIVDKDSNKEPNEVSDLRIISPTLIKIENKKVTSYIEETENVKNELKK